MQKKITYNGKLKAEGDQRRKRLRAEFIMSELSITDFAAKKNLSRQRIEQLLAERK